MAVSYEEAFDHLWDQLAEQGRCDARGGAEYERIKNEWKKRGFCFAAWLFIVTHAGVSPPGKIEDVHSDLPPSGNGDDLADEEADLGADD